tara:strand:+ start:383 stop:526 length:144 start_codon:yes stop_codon:yes gene_type:complete
MAKPAMNQHKAMAEGKMPEASMTAMVKKKTGGLIKSKTPPKKSASKC